MTPRTFHWHQFSYVKPAKDWNNLYPDSSFARNFLMVAAAYADKCQVLQLRNALSNKLSCEDSDDLVKEVLADGSVREEREWIAANAKFKSIYELREMFNREGVVN